MNKYLFIICLFVIANSVNAQSTSSLMGARAAGMGYASSGLADEWSVFNNPGGLGKTDQLAAGFAYEIRPQLKGTNRMAAVLNLPLKWATLSAGAFKFGDDLYSEQIISTGIGNQFGIASLGLKMNLVQYRSEGFGTFHAFSIDFGGLTQLTEKFAVSAYINNLNQAKINPETDEYLPTKITAGITFKPEKHILISSEISKDLDYQSTWRTGLEYIVKEKIFFRTGFNLNPNAAFFGVGAHKKKVRIDYAISYNELIGITHQASASYLFSQKSKQ